MSTENEATNIASVDEGIKAIKETNNAIIANKDATQKVQTITEVNRVQLDSVIASLDTIDRKVDANVKLDAILDKVNAIYEHCVGGKKNGNNGYG